MSSNIERDEKFMEELKLLCSEYGWDILVDVSGVSVPGLVLGTPEYLVTVMEEEIDYSNYDVIECNSEPEVVH